MAASDSSSALSDPPSSEDELPPKPSKPTLKLLNNGKLGFSRARKESPESSPEPSPGRETSPPHEYVLADNQDIAIIVMFRSRFDSAFSKHVPNIGPQDLENGVVATEPSPQVEDLLCALLGLVLNRKKNPERGHYGRALEEAISSQRSQWPTAWGGNNPLPGSKSFETMSPAERLLLLKTLVLWALNTSESIMAIIRDSYKQTRRDDDINQPLSIQPWGMDTLKRKYYLIEGLVDTPFRIYRESFRKGQNPTWWSVAGSIEDAQKLARDLRAEKGQAAHRFAAKITNAMPVFEEREEKRKRKEYRQARKAAFARPEPGFSLYEGRTRGKRMRYTYDDDEAYGSDEEGSRRSGPTGASTPADGPMYTASGRQVRSQYAARPYGEPSRLQDGASSVQDSPQPGEDGASADSSDSVRRDGRPRRTGRPSTSSFRKGGRHNEEYDSSDDLDDDDDAPSSGEEWGGDDDDVEGKDDEDDGDEDDLSVADSEDSLGVPRSQIVRLKVGKGLAGFPAANGIPKPPSIHAGPVAQSESPNPPGKEAFSSPPNSNAMEGIIMSQPGADVAGIPVSRALPFQNPTSPSRFEARPPPTNLSEPLDRPAAHAPGEVSYQARPLTTYAVGNGLSVANGYNTNMSNVNSPQSQLPGVQGADETSFHQPKMQTAYTNAQEPRGGAELQNNLADPKAGFAYAPPMPEDPAAKYGSSVPRPIWLPQQP